MKIAISSKGKELDSLLDSRFGRARYFIIYDGKADTFSVMDNSMNFDAAQGAGIQTAQNVLSTGVEHIITGHCGPKAYKVLSLSAAKLYLKENGTVKEAIDDLIGGKLKAANNADVEGHWM
ncbi:MAG TPA: dinitrogenase iron-molybdenum cofactor biosynthesis protein [Lentisphaeria bacterium]|nr:MAG: dinitrogenase iron-molybdenum cofactor biosynthesis protein [Lentisphaerae bacterium GWF2_38_69]HBM15544.1 dinitrogenase iron-molybdenum cofactor biosynthesis protein [Lentisphaeria bacterium]